MNPSKPADERRPLEPRETETARSPRDAATAALPSSSLLRGRSMVQIEHNGAVYQLRSTRLGKLILTK